MHAISSSETKEQILEAAAYELLAVRARCGEGMNVDVDASYWWMCRAAELGSVSAKQDLPRYHKKLFGGYSFK